MKPLHLIQTFNVFLGHGISLLYIFPPGIHYALYVTSQRAAVEMIMWPLKAVALGEKWAIRTKKVYENKELCLISAEERDETLQTLR